MLKFSVLAAIILFIPSFVCHANEQNVEKTESSVQITIGDEIDIWKKAIAEETKKLVTSGYTELSEVKELVSKTTHEQELDARKVYSKINEELNRIAIEATKQYADEDLRELTVSFEENINKAQSEMIDKVIMNIKNELIEENFNKHIGTH